MEIRSISRFVLAGVLLMSFNASAVPGLWQQGYGQGNAEYSVTNSSGKMFTINCTENPDQNGIYQHSVFLTLAGDKTISSHDNSTDITVVMDHKQYAVPSTLGWRNGDNAWFDFIMDIRKTGQFDVYVNDRKAGTFTVDLKNAEKVLPIPGDCSND
ncbi:protein YfjT [Citrobacter freundii]|uniref:protein YfjT n=1 Tax=Citrobacter freundii TaxID=546 RepID=UPI0028BEE596|nr:protein YfjT [Citrobacter freundii]MDT7052799.1 protein YfjT [Citrobacter freundii]